MCYSIYLSTESPTDFQSLRLTRARFEPVSTVPFPILQYPRQWYLTREFGGCSCHFRCLMSEDPEFGAPEGSDSITSSVISLKINGAEAEMPPLGSCEDRLNEDEDDVAATCQVFELFRSLVASGYGLDLLCVWEQESTKLDQIRRFVVSINQVNESTFRFFENSYFAFRIAV